MLNRNFALVATAASLLMLSACATPGQRPAASGTTPQLSSRCLGDYAIPYEPGLDGEADPDNVLDSKETVDAIRQHNVGYHAACPDSGNSL